MKLFCDKCKCEFVPSPDQMEHLKNSQSKGMKFIMIACSLCGRSFPMNPMSTKSPDANKKIGDGLRCPCKTCSGIISYVEDATGFWGCGECGTVWFDKNDLFREIENISRRYSYRRKVYVKDKNFGFLPVDLEKEPKNYENLVESEWNDKP
ncbi:MAG: hypothetical protein LBS89_01390 [Zoogloeaceae bacterium]|jgi:hypothetical protein|nr:hypothetical protein [Zoogloeaceae bacterium]